MNKECINIDGLEYCREVLVQATEQVANQGISDTSIIIILAGVFVVTLVLLPLVFMGLGRENATSGG